MPVLPLRVQLDSERASLERQQTAGFVRKEQSRPAHLLIVLSRCARDRLSGACIRPRAGAWRPAFRAKRDVDVRHDDVPAIERAGPRLARLVGRLDAESVEVYDTALEAVLVEQLELRVGAR
jgi:hypothetical protein